MLSFSFGHFFVVSVAVFAFYPCCYLSSTSLLYDLLPYLPVPIFLLPKFPVAVFSAVTCSLFSSAAFFRFQFLHCPIFCCQFSRLPNFPFLFPVAFFPLPFYLLTLLLFFSTWLLYGLLPYLASPILPLLKFPVVVFSSVTCCCFSDAAFFRCPIFYLPNFPLPFFSCLFYVVIFTFYRCCYFS